MISPVVFTFYMFELDTFNFVLNWRQKCGPTYDLSVGWEAMLKLYVSNTDRTLVYQITTPAGIDGEGITLGSVSPNIIGKIIHDNVLFDPKPTFYTLELNDPIGDLNRVAHGPVVYTK